MRIKDLVTELENRILSSGNDIDFLTYKESSSIISRIASLLIAVLCRLIIIIVPLICSLEIIYICFPAFREKLDTLSAKLESTDAGKKLVGLTLRDAKEAVKGAYCSNKCNGTTGEMLAIYLRIKLKSLMFVFFIISIVINGSSYIINFVWEIFGKTVMMLFE